MHHSKPLRWVIDTSTSEPMVTFFREVDGHGDVHSRPFNKQALIDEIDIKKDRGDEDLSSWQAALHDLTHIH